MEITRKTATPCGVTIGYDPGLGLVYPLTACCEASGKGSPESRTGVICRSCHEPVAGTYGDVAMLTDRAQLSAPVAKWLAATVNCPDPDECARVAMRDLTGVWA